MASSDHLEDLRRRVQLDPASIAFAQLAEEQRRLGQLAEAVATCRTGLETHPGFMSARVTLGRALLALGQLEEAAAELQTALAVNPDSYAATRALADTFRQLGRRDDALSFYESAQKLAPNDPDLDRIIRTLRSGGDAAHSAGDSDAVSRRAAATVAALEKWTEAIHAVRAQRRT